MCMYSVLNEQEKVVFITLGHLIFYGRNFERLFKYLFWGMDNLLSTNSAMASACFLFLAPSVILYNSTLAQGSDDPPCVIIWPGWTLTVTYYKKTNKTTLSLLNVQTGHELHCFATVLPFLTRLFIEKI